MFTIETAAALTESQIELLTGPQLAQAYNVLAPKANVAPIKKFTDRATGIKRLLPVVKLVHDRLAASAAVKPTSKKAAKVEAPTAERPMSLSATIRALIQAGKSNAEIMAEAQLPASKKHYPQWYRSEMVRNAARA